MIDYNRKLSNERETDRMSIIVLLETLTFIKNYQCHTVLREKSLAIIYNGVSHR